MIVNRFETVLADTPTARDIHYRLRYRVFCEEEGFEDPARFPDQLERDAFDEHAVHFLVWDRLEREWVGGSRFVTDTSPSLPCEGIVGGPLRWLDERRSRAAEFSRLCIISKVRRTESGVRCGMLGPNGATIGGKETLVFFRQQQHEILLRMLWASTIWGEANDVDFLYCLVHRALARLLGRFGMDLIAVGAAVEHRGTRMPHCYEARSANAGIRRTLPAFASRIDEAGAFVKYSAFVERSPMAATAAQPLDEFPIPAAMPGYHRRMVPSRAAAFAKRGSSAAG